MELVGRNAQIAELEGVHARAREGSPAAVLICGGPGQGKTALLHWFADHAQAAGSRVVRVTGVEFEAELAYGCLSDIVSGLSDRADRLDEHHRQSLERAVGLDSTGPPGLVLYVAALALLRATARARPLALIVDDAHWIDQCSLDILLFCAR